MPTIPEIENLIAQARPLSDEDYASERQQTLENQVYTYLESILTPKQYEAFSNYCLKATVDECLDAALYVVNGDINWLSKWQ
jgi:hypothetical protein